MLDLSTCQFEDKSYKEKGWDELERLEEKKRSAGRHFSSHHLNESHIISNSSNEMRSRSPDCVFKL